MKIYTFDSLESTNTYLKDNHEKYNNEDVIHAISQTNGRGRFTRVWVSGNDLTFSILFKDTSYNHKLISPLSIIYALKKHNINAGIKWPNDIYLNGMKLAGILQESVFIGSQRRCEIVGIGINTTKKETSLNATYVPIPNKELLEDIIYNYKNLLEVDEELLLSEYKKHSCILGMPIKYDNDIFTISGFTIDMEIILENDTRKIYLNANELDIKSSIIKK